MKTPSIRMSGYLLLIPFFALAACKAKTRETDMTPKHPEIIVHDDTVGVAKLVRLPTPVLSARWTDIPLVAGADPRRDLGPTDMRLFVLVRIDGKSWPAWEKALTKPKEKGDYHVPEAVANGLLPPDILSRTIPDAKGRRIDAEIFLPDSLATSWYEGVAAVRLGDYVLMEFTSH